MKIKKYILPLVVILGIVMGYGIMSTLNNSALAQHDYDQDFDVNELYKKTKKIFKECIDIPKISEEQAINIAQQTGPKNAKHIHAQYGVLTDENIMLNPSREDIKNNPKLANAEYIKELPVWIVSFRGLEIKRRGGVKTEFNFVIDAQTGNILYAFVFR
jgi:predicted small secreted protein